MEYDVDKWDVELSEFDDTPLNKKNKKDVKMVKEYCKEHETSHSGDKCKPSWCGDCGFLINYEIIVKHDK